MRKKTQQLLKTYFNITGNIFAKNMKIIFHEKQENEGKSMMYQLLS